MAKPHQAKIAFGYEDIQLLINTDTDIVSRDEVNLSTRLSKNVQIRYPIVLSPMDTVSCVESCVAMNLIGGAGILHRFMPLEERIKAATKIKEESDRCFLAVGLNDTRDDLNQLSMADAFFLDCAHGGMRKVLEWIKDFKEYMFDYDLITGNTQTMESVSQHLELGAAGIRHGIGIGSACLTTVNTGIGCPALTSNYYAWKARQQWMDMHKHLAWKENTPTILTDGGIKEPGHLVKAIASGADAIIAGRIFAGCKETPGDVYWTSTGEPINKEKVILNISGDFTKKYRGMASRSVQEEAGKEHVFVEGDEYKVPYTGKSVEDVVLEYCDGLKSAMSYLGFRTLNELKGSLWTDKVKYITLTPNSHYEGQSHGKASS